MLGAGKNFIIIKTTVKRNRKLITQPCFVRRRHNHIAVIIYQNLQVKLHQLLKSILFCFLHTYF